MMDIIMFAALLVSSLLSLFTKISLIMIILQKRKFLKDKRFWISVILVGIYVFLSYLITDVAIKVIFEFIFLVTSCWFIHKFEMKYFISIVVASFIVWVTLLLIDIILYIELNNLGIELIMIDSNGYLKFFMSSLSCILLSLPFIFRKVRKIFFRMTMELNNIKNWYVIVLIMLSVSVFSIIVYVCLFNYNTTFILCSIFIMIIIYTVVTIITINEYNQKNKIQSEYDILLTNLSEYENLLDIQRVSNHENKNQLLVIKGMVSKKEKNVAEYIDSIIDTQYADNEALIMKTNRIPSGGLRGLIYYKMLMMKDKKIDVTLVVDRNLREFNFSEIPIKMNQELCKIVGVFLDNAIQAVENINNKSIEIFISYLNDDLMIKISNSYEGDIELDKIDSKGYTTKGKGHGYGLNLVKHIIDGNNKFINEREINKRLFSQIIKLKI